MPKSSKQQMSPMRFESVSQADVPKGRDGKHKAIIQQLLSDILQLGDRDALKIPLSALPDSKENIRSALNRTTRQEGIDVATSSDEQFLYVWKTTNKVAAKGDRYEESQ